MKHPTSTPELRALLTACCDQHSWIWGGSHQSLVTQPLALSGSPIAVTHLSVTKDSCFCFLFYSVHHLVALEGCTSAIIAILQLVGRGKHKESEAFPF